MDEPPGPNCENGGLRITAPDGTAQFVCDGVDGTDGTDGAAGASGTQVTLADEPPGENCAAGGVRITTSNGTISYVCAGESAPPEPPSYCDGPAYSVDGSDLGTFVEIRANGELLDGPDSTPTTGGAQAISRQHRAVAACRGFTISADDRRVPSFLTVVVRVSRTAPRLMEAFARAQAIETRIRSYRESATGEPELEREVGIVLARIAAFDEFFGPDPDDPSRLIPLLRLQLVYRTLEEASYPGGVTATVVVADWVTFGVPAPPLDCTAFLPMAGRELGSRLIANGVDLVGANGGFETLAHCWSARRTYEAGGSGRMIGGPLQILKRVDSTSSSLLGAYVARAAVEVSLDYFDASSVTSSPIYRRDGEDGRIHDYRQYVVGGSRVEVLSISATMARAIWLDGGITFETVWVPAP